jgi:hypothetical protein
MRRQRENYFNRDRNGGPSRVFVESVHRLRWWRRRPANKKSIPVDTVFEGKRKRSPTTRTRAVLIADMMILEGEAALKPAR